MKIADAMSVDVITVSQGTSLKDAAALLDRSTHASRDRRADKKRRRSCSG
jgi:hypothetical protein